MRGRRGIYKRIGSRDSVIKNVLMISVQGNQRIRRVEVGDNGLQAGTSADKLSRKKKGLMTSQKPLKGGSPKKLQEEKYLGIRAKKKSGREYDDPGGGEKHAVQEFNAKTKKGMERRSLSPR